MEISRRQWTHRGRTPRFPGELGRFALSVAPVVMALSLAGCNEGNLFAPDDPEVLVSGVVRDQATGDPVPEATVEIAAPAALQRTTATDSLGLFFFVLAADSAVEITLEASKDGFIGGSTTVEVIPHSDATGLLIELTPVEAGSADLTLPLRGAFYYPWYPETWSVGGVHVSYQVALGYYSSDDQDVVDAHIQALDYAKIDVAIASWWGPGTHSEDSRFPMLLDRTVAAGSDLRWAAYYEDEGFANPSVEQLQADLAYLIGHYTNHEAYARIDGKPVIFVYSADDSSCEVADRWAQATAGHWYVDLKVFGGFRDCTHQPSSWHQYGPNSPAQQHEGYSYVIAPGFWRADQEDPLLVRDIDRWNQNVRDMVASGEPWQLITTFNEWGEGTAVERAYEWTSQSGQGLYLDALHNDGNPGG